MSGDAGTPNSTSIVAHWSKPTQHLSDMPQEHYPFGVLHGTGYVRRATT